MDIELERYVREILIDIKRRGIEALKEYSAKFDFYDGELRVSEEEFKEAEKEIREEEKRAIKDAIKRVEGYHKIQIERDLLYIKKGSLYGIIHRPLRRIGIYVPGGKPLPSSLIMTAVPARIAGVKEIVVTTPPRKGKINLHVLYTAKILEIEEIYKLGGIQAIAAMAYGIAMDKVDKIFGPGNRFVNEAKRQVFGDVGIDSLAGPSEIAIIADDTANREYIKLDLLSQLEHGNDSRAWLLTTSKSLANFCNSERVEIILCKTIEECAEKANEMAPEHLEILTENPISLVELIENAGAIYLGEYTPVPAGDYFLGVNHVLPTGGAARFSSVLTVSDFMKRISIAMVSREEFLECRDIGIALAKMEGMKIHKKSMEVRR